jgi:phenylpropionate dioxygenase-like ring-hydroxylating dioxygenase large terminal subunit
MDVFPIDPFPTGWFQVAYSKEIASGDVVPMTYFGRDLVCYRAGNGELRVIDAYCPHLGAHLGFGGRLDGDDLICPFHEWRFDLGGRNIEIPYASRPNRKACLSSWPSRELDGLVFVWHGPDHEAPTWQIPSIPELSDDAFARPAITELEIAVHPQDIFENAVDIAHFLSIHRAGRMPDVSVTTDGPRFVSTTTNQSLKSNTGYFEGAVESELWGLGLDVARITGVIDTVAVLTLTPIDGVQVKARFAVTARINDRTSEDQSRAERLAAKAQARILDEFNSDLAIWQHKKYAPSPNLASGEKLITQYRKWAQQFYWPNGAGDDRRPGVSIASPVR